MIMFVVWYLVPDLEMEMRASCRYGFLVIQSCDDHIDGMVFGAGLGKDGAFDRSTR